VITRFAAAAAALLLTLSACSGDDDGEADTDALRDRLGTAQKQLDAAESIDLTLSTKSVPTGVTGLLRAEGTGNHQPAFKGTVTVVTGGASLDADIIAVDGSVWAKTAFSPRYLTIDPATLKAPEPASLFEPGDGISGLLEATEELRDDGQKRDGDDVLRTISGTLEGGEVQALIPTADTGGTFVVKWRLDDDDQLRDGTLEGPFYAERNVTYSVTVSTSDEPVTITAP